MAKLGNRWFRVTPDTGATFSWITGSHFKHDEYSLNLETPEWLPKLAGFDSEKDKTAQFQVIDEEAPGIYHDGFKASSSWIMENIFLEDTSKQSTIQFPIKLQLLDSLMNEFHLNFDLLLGLGIEKNHPINSNWLLLAQLSGMAPKFTFRCGLGHRAKPTLAFGMGLLPKDNYRSRYYAIQKHETDQPGSQWYLRMKRIIWKCKDQDKEDVMDADHWNYAQSWKNTSKDKIWSARAFSWAWFDTGYCTITLPKSLCNSDTLEMIKFLKDIKAGSLAVQAGTLAPPVILEEIKLEWISFVFDYEVDVDGNPTETAEHRWTFTIEDLVDLKTGYRGFELEIESPAMRKCVIIGLPFAKKFSVEYNFDPFTYTSNWTGDKGKEILGFEYPLSQ
jgi:hypothetical protein